MSQFKKLFESIESGKDEVKDKPEKQTVESRLKGASSAVTKKNKKPTNSKNSTENVEEPKTITASPQLGSDGPKPSRRAGKSSSAEYTQVLTYIKKDTHKRIKKALIDDEQERDLSDLAEELLVGWLKKTGS